MHKYKVKIRQSYGPLSESDLLIEGNEYYFAPTFTIAGGHALGEVMMAACDLSYPHTAPKCLALGDLELIDNEQE